MARSLTDSIPMRREVALLLCQCEMGDYVELGDGRVMRLDSWECFTKNFTGRVMFQEMETQKILPMSKLIVVLDEGVPCRELRVRSGALPLVYREAVEPAALSSVNGQESIVQQDEKLGS